MEDNEQKLVEIFTTLFEIPKEKVPQATIQNTEKWDSLSHMNLILELEQEITKGAIDLDLVATLTTFDACLELLHSGKTND